MVAETFGKFRLLPENLDKGQTLRTGPGPGQRSRVGFSPLASFGAPHLLHRRAPQPAHTALCPEYPWTPVSQTLAQPSCQLAGAHPLEPTVVAFSLSKWLLWQPDHWKISCLQRDRFSWRRRPAPSSSPSHLAQVQYEGVSFVETLPADRNLRCPDNMSTFDLQQSRNLHVVGQHVLEARGHTTRLWDRVETPSGIHESSTPRSSGGFNPKRLRRPTPTLEASGKRQMQTFCWLPCT